MSKRPAISCRKMDGQQGNQNQNSQWNWFYIGTDNQMLNIRTHTDCEMASKVKVAAFYKWLKKFPPRESN